MHFESYDQKEHAEAIANQLQTNVFPHIYSSDLMECQAELLLDYSNVNVTLFVSKVSNTSMIMAPYVVCSVFIMETILIGMRPVIKFKQQQNTHSDLSDRNSEIQSSRHPRRQGLHGREFYSGYNLNITSLYCFNVAVDISFSIPQLSNPRMILKYPLSPLNKLETRNVPWILASPHSSC